MVEIEVKKGTTVVGIVYKDGVVLASETRASLGHLAIHKEHKVKKLTDNIGMGVAGTVADMQILYKWLKTQLDLYTLNKDIEPTVDVASSLLSNALYGGGKSFFPHMVMVLLGGKADEEFKLFSLDPVGSSIADKYTTIGSGMELALGVLDDGYKDGMTQDMARKLAIKALTVAVRRDIASGDGIEIYAIDDKGFRQVDFVKFRDALRDE